MQDHSQNLDQFFHTIINAIPSPLLVEDQDLRIIQYNSAASVLFGQEPEHILRHKTGDTLHCVNAAKTTKGCGHSADCSSCNVRNSVKQAFADKMINRLKTKMDLVSGNKVQEIHLLVTTSPFVFKENRYVLLLLEDISELIQLKRMLPICARCKKIRDDKEYWHNLEGYLQAHLDLDFTHGICPGCALELYPELYSNDE